MSPSQTYDFAFVCCSIAAVALLIWEHIITFGREVHVFWGRKFSGPTILYSLLRYGTLFEKISVLLLASWYLTPHACNIAVRFQIFPMILRSLGYGFFSALRVYALRENKWPLAVFVFLLCMPSLIMPAYVYAHQTAHLVNQFGCQLGYTASQELHTRRESSLVLIGTSIFANVALLSCCSTNRGSCCRPIGRDNRHCRHGKPDIQFAKRNGYIGRAAKEAWLYEIAPPRRVYFFALLILSLADMLVLVFDHVPSFATRYDYWVVPYYTPVFRTIIICRFLLMLRRIYYDDDANEGEPGEPPLGTLKFLSTVIGTMAAPVGSQFDDYGHEAWEDDSDDIVYSRDPLATGLIEMETYSSSLGQGKGKEKEITSSEEDIRSSNEV